jgi:hypothetical protein
VINGVVERVFRQLRNWEEVVGWKAGEVLRMPVSD